jgi:hypothetical protein
MTMTRIYKKMNSPWHPRRKQIMIMMKTMITIQKKNPDQLIRILNI